MTVYLVIDESNVNDSTEINVKVFANYKDAKKALDKEIVRAREDAGDDWIEDYDVDSYVTYLEGEYSINHISVMMLEKEVL